MDIFFFLNKLYYPPVHYIICTTVLERILIPKLDYRFFARAYESSFLYTQSKKFQLKIGGWKLSMMDGPHELTIPTSPGETTINFRG